MKVPAKNTNFHKAEQILIRLLPEKSRTIVELTRMLHTEREHKLKLRHSSMPTDKEFKFSKFDLQDVHTERTEIEQGIFEACAKLAPNYEYAEVFKSYL